MRLNPSLARTLRALREFDGDERFAAALLEKRSLVQGLSPERLVSDIAELRDAGMVRTFEFPNRLHDAAVFVGRSLFQLICGAAGGLVVWLLTKLVP